MLQGWKQKIRLNEKGMTLAEVLVAMAILLVVLDAMLSLQFSGFNNGIEANKKTQAVLLAQAKLEEARTKVLSAPLPITENETYNAIPNFNQFSRSTTYSIANPSDAQSLIKINVVVRWMDHSSNEQSLAVSSLRFKM